MAGYIRNLSKFILQQICHDYVVNALPEEAFVGLSPYREGARKVNLAKSMNYEDVRVFQQKIDLLRPVRWLTHLVYLSNIFWPNGFSFPSQIAPFLTQKAIRRKFYQFRVQMFHVDIL